jgi:hypothetical protein
MVGTTLGPNLGSDNHVFLLSKGRLLKVFFNKRNDIIKILFIFILDFSTQKLFQSEHKLKMVFYFNFLTGVRTIFKTGALSWHTKARLSVVFKSVTQRFLSRP